MYEQVTAHNPIVIKTINKENGNLKEQQEKQPRQSKTRRVHREEEKQSGNLHNISTQDHIMRFKKVM